MNDRCLRKEEYKKGKKRVRSMTDFMQKDDNHSGDTHDFMIIKII